MIKRYLTVIFLLLAVPATLHARDFLNSVVNLNFGGMYSFAASGDILDSEKRYTKSGITDSKSVSHYETAGFVTLDIVPANPVIFGLEEHAVKFGVRGSYSFHYLEQRVTTDTEFGDKVIDYSSWMIGPVIHYSPFVSPSDINDDYTSNGGFTFFALYGKIYGDLTAYPAVREYDKKNSITFTDQYKSKIRGSKFDIGVGAEIALCSVNVGINIYYSYISVNMKDTIYTDVGHKGYLKEGCIELYLGIPIESFIEPLIPKF